MRAPAAFQVSIRCFGVWRGAVFAVVTLAALSTLVWVLTQPLVMAPWLLGYGGIVLVALFWVSSSLMSLRPISLRWDGQGWRLGPADSGGQEPWAGELGVAMDLGPWMLLRFRHGALNRRTRSTWIPVQRRGLEPQWHALRCAIYSTRPAPGTTAEAGFQPPPHERP